MQHEIVGFIIKLIGSFGLWYVGTRMLYQNEMDRPRHERVADKDIVLFLSGLWPIWIVGLAIASVCYLLHKLVGGVFVHTCTLFQKRE